MKLKIITIVFFFLLVLVQNSKAQKTELDELLKKTLKESKIPGIAVAVCTSDSILYYNALGVIKIGEKQNINPDESYFHLGDNAKAFTALWAAILVENGKIKWNSKIADIFPEWANKIHKSFDSTTLSDLLAHRTGLPALMEEKECKPYLKLKGTVVEKRIEFSKKILQQKPKTIEKDQVYSYSNAGYLVATAMLERVSEMDWETAIKNDIGQKLNIDIKTGWPAKISVGQPLGHAYINDKFMPQEMDKPVSTLDFMSPAIDISIKIKDYGIFLQQFLKGLYSSNVNLLSSLNYDYLLKGKPVYSMGWMFFDKELTISHEGTQGTFYVYTAISLKKNVALTFVSNAMGTKVKDTVYSLRDGFISLLKRRKIF
jgi:D-alanyl-D-alanine carboxypeptidase